jgi:sec-independent protein translocase protein TatC
MALFNLLNLLNKRNNNTNGEMSFVEHLDDLRRTLFRSILGMVVAAIVVGFNFDFLFEKIILGPKHTDFPTFIWLCKMADKFNLPALCIKAVNIDMQNTTVNGQLNLYFEIIFTGSIILAFPWILYQIWGFIKPALKNNEKNSATSFVFFVSILFFLGVAFGYYILTPYCITFMGSFSVSKDIKNIWTMDSYLENFNSLILGTGIAFQLPLAIYYLAKVGIVTKSFLLSYSRYIILAIVVLAAVITPPDVVSQIIVSLPLIFLFYLGVIIAGRQEKKRLEKENVNAQEWS